VSEECPGYAQSRTVHRTLEWISSRLKTKIPMDKVKIDKKLGLLSTLAISSLSATKLGLSPEVSLGPKSPSAVIAQ